MERVAVLINVLIGRSCYRMGLAKIVLCLRELKERVRSAVQTFALQDRNYLRMELVKTALHIQESAIIKRVASRILVTKEKV